MNKELQNQIKGVFRDIVEAKELDNTKLRFTAELREDTWVDLHVYPVKPNNQQVFRICLKRLMELFEQVFHAEVAISPDHYVCVAGNRKLQVFQITIHQFEEEGDELFLEAKSNWIRGSEDSIDNHHR